jgi:hypothetical protein
MEQGLLTVREVAALLGFGSEDPVRRLVPARVEAAPRRVQAAGGGVLPWERRRRAGKAA